MTSVSATETKSVDSRDQLRKMLKSEPPANEGSLTAPEDRDPTKRWRPTMAAPLNDEEMKSAKDDLINTSYVTNYTKAERSYADPVLPDQLLGLISFTPAKDAKPNKNGVYGFAKLRGNYATLLDADKRAEFLVRNHDSYNQISTCYVGRPFPLTEMRKFSDEIHEVDLNKEAAESMGNAIKRQQKKDAREMQEIKDREKLLKEDVKKKPGDDPFEDYITARVKRAQLVWNYKEHQKKMAEVKDLILKCRDKIEEMDKEFPEFDGKYFDKYRQARVDAGLDETTEESEQNFMKYLVKDIELDF